MARIAGVDLPRDKRVEIGLTSIYGIGRTSATKIVDKAGVNPDTRCRDLTDEEVKKLSEVISEDYMVEGDLRREVAMNIKRLSEIGCYRGIRTSSVSVRSAATEASVTEKAFLSAARRPRPMQEPERVRRRPSQTRRNN